MTLACAPGTGKNGTGGPPVPPNQDELDPRVLRRIAEARAKVEAAPTEASAWAELGMIFEAERLRASALACYEEAERRAPREPRWPYRRASTLAAQGRIEEASRALQAALALAPDHAPSHWKAGTYALELADVAAAERSFRRAVELDPSFPGGWLGLARVHLERDEPARALELLEDLLARNPGDPFVLQLLSYAQRQAGRVSASGAVTLENEDVPVWNDPWEREAQSFREDPTILRAGQLIQRGQAAEAIALLEAGRAEGADPRGVSLRLARALVQLGRLAEAERELRAFLALEPENSHAHLLLARVRERQGDVPGALAVLESVTALHPTHGAAWAAQGFLLYRAEEFARAARALRRAIEYGERGNEARSTLAQALLATKSWEEARTVLEELLAESPALGDGWAMLARARIRLGDFSGGTAAIQRAERAGVSRPEYLEQVVELLERSRAPREGATGEGESGERR
jgi:tetratricopeptide (TPR) repeat protein